MTKKRKTEEELAEELVCSECGETNIQVKVWVNANNHKEPKGATEGDIADNWCEDCQEHTEHVTRKEYEELQTTNDYEPNISDG